MAESIVSLSMFDPANQHHYLVQELSRVHSTFNGQEQVQHLMRRYGVSRSLAEQAVRYIRSPA